MIGQKIFYFVKTVKTGAGKNDKMMKAKQKKDTGGVTHADSCHRPSVDTA